MAIALALAACSRPPRPPLSGNPPVLTQLQLIGSPIIIADKPSYCGFADMLRTADNRLLVVYTAGTSHADTHAIIEARHSRDEGRTWTPATVASPDTACRDPHILQLANGTLLLTYFTDPGDLSRIRPRLVRSTDGGRTWGRPESIDIPPQAQWLATGGRICATSAGELLLPAHGQFQADKGWRAGLLRSRDAGKTWRDWVTVAAPDPAHGEDRSEMELAELSHGQLVALVRPGWRVVSHDHGRTWEPPQYTLRLHAPGLLVDGPNLLMNYRADGYGAASLAVSHDGGKTWPTTQPLCGPFGADCAYGAIIKTCPGSPAPYFTVYYAPHGNSVKVLGQYFRLTETPAAGAPPP